MNKLHEIIGNEINGSTSEYRSAIKKLKKREIIELVGVWVNDYNTPLYKVLHIINKSLEA